MTLYYFMQRLKKKYNVVGLYNAPKDIVELWFHFEHTSVYLQYSGSTIRDSTYKNALKQIEDDLKFYEEDK